MPSARFWSLNPPSRIQSEVKSQDSSASSALAIPGPARNHWCAPAKELPTEVK